MKTSEKILGDGLISHGPQFPSGILCKQGLTKPYGTNKIVLKIMKKFRVEISKGRFKIHGLVHEVGQDILVSIWGGTRPHIGAIGMAIPRRSLKNARQWSATSSNFTFEGHKEDLLVKKISEKLATRMRRNVVVCAGVHWDGITAKEIQRIENLIQKISDDILRKFLPAHRQKKRVK